MQLNLDDIGGMSRAELDTELIKGIESLKSGRLYTADEVDVELAKEFGLWVIDISHLFSGSVWWYLNYISLILYEIRILSQYGRSRKYAVIIKFL